NHVHPLAFPTRRSSDLGPRRLRARLRGRLSPPRDSRFERTQAVAVHGPCYPGSNEYIEHNPDLSRCHGKLTLLNGITDDFGHGRSEEHTSELQSRENLV